VRAIARWPWPFLLLLVGSVIASLGLVKAPTLSSWLLLLIFIPPLLFDAAFSMRLAAVRRELHWILLLGLVGSVVAAAVAFLLLLAIGFPRNVALLLAAALAATDPVSVFAALRSVRAAERVRVVLEGESLVNDGVAAVLFVIALGVAQSNQPDLAAELLIFLRLSLGGVLLGLMVGVVAAPLLARVHPLAGVAVTVVVAYGAYLLADRLGFSGLLSVIAAAFWLGNAPGKPAHRMVDRFWRMDGFIFSSVVFLLMGLQVRLGDLLGTAAPLLGLVGIVLLARTVMVLAVTSWSPSVWPVRWRAALVWGGLRGALSLALVLSITGVAERSTIVLLAFGFVFLTLIAQGLSIGPVFRWLGLSSPRVTPAVR
jgi:CPA1 family monovalent cation:H+ antiporter